ATEFPGCCAPGRRSSTSAADEAPSLGNPAGRVTYDRRGFLDIASHHASGADDRIVAYCDARQNDGAASDPYIAADANRTSPFQPLAALCSIARMVGAVDLDRRSDLRAVTDTDLRDVEHDAVVIEEHVVS